MLKWRSKPADIKQSQRIRTSAAVNADTDTMTEEVSGTQMLLPGLTERRPTSRLKHFYRESTWVLGKHKQKKGSFELNLFGWAAQRLILKNSGLETQIWLTRQHRVCNHLNALVASEVLPTHTLRCPAAASEVCRRESWELWHKTLSLGIWLYLLCSSRVDTPLNGVWTNRSIKLFTDMPSSFHWAISIGTICVHPKNI